MKQGSLESIVSKIDSNNICSHPLVSIIIPTYNTPPRLFKRCIQSLFEQTYDNIELIVVDDGSAPVYSGILAKFANKDSRIRLIGGGHKGVSHARNVGIDAAEGDWIAFVDADDTVDASYISESVDLALEESLDMVCGSVCYVYANGIIEGYTKQDRYSVIDHQESLLLAAQQMLAPYAVSEFSGPNYHGRGPVAKLFRSSIIDGLRFEEKVKLGEDALFNYQFIKCCRSIAIVNRTWYYYLQNETSAMHSSDMATRKSSIDGILASRTEVESPAPFLARCSLVASDGVEGLVRNQGILRGRKDGVALLRYAAERGCFSRLAAEGLEIPRWASVLWRACRGGHFEFGYFFWGLKTRVKDSMNRRHLIRGDEK